jgi:hypothetical protein
MAVSADMTASASDYGSFWDYSRGSLSEMYWMTLIKDLLSSHLPELGSTRGMTWIAPASADHLIRRKITDFHSRP